MRTWILALPGVLDASLGLTFDVLGAANRLQVRRGSTPLFRLALTSPRGGRVRTGSGLEIGPAVPLPAVARADVIIIPGANYPERAGLEAWLESTPVRQVLRWLQNAARRGAVLTASCCSTFVLAEAGLLAGRAATTTWWLAGTFRERYPDIALDMDRMVVADGRIITAGAALAQADLMLGLVTKFGGPELARRCARYLLLDERTSQTRYAFVDHLARQNPDSARAERWIRGRLHQAISVREMAAALHLGPRTLARRIEQSTGSPPLALVQRLKVERAVHQLETTDTPFEEIARDLAYEDPGALRRLIVREMGTTPRQIRARRAARRLPATARRQRHPTS